MKIASQISQYVKTEISLFIVHCMCMREYGSTLYIGIGCFSYRDWSIFIV